MLCLGSHQPGAFFFVSHRRTGVDIDVQWAPLTKAEVASICKEVRDRRTECDDGTTNHNRELLVLGRVRSQKMTAIARDAFGRWEALQNKEPWDPINMVDVISYGVRRQGMLHGQIILYVRPHS